MRNRIGAAWPGFSHEPVAALRPPAWRNSQNCAQPCRDVRDLLAADGVRHRVLAPLDLAAEALQRRARLPGALDGDDVVEAAVGHEQRHAEIDGAVLRREAA